METSAAFGNNAGKCERAAYPWRGMPPGGEQGQLDPNGGQGQMDPDGGTGQADPNGSSSSNGSTTPSTPKQGNTLPVPAT